MSGLLTAAVAAVAVLFAVLMVAEQRRWRAYQRASQELADRTNMARPAEVAGRADTSTIGGLTVPIEHSNHDGQRGAA